ncbi:pullulanase [Klebsiella pneumoniae subsp. ozaenae]|uniref:Pullulanase n=1 Tax=Klebsiella pneumoniae subsp. ozaenae TaxID=574 RepID=A0A377Z1J6_KLEPO|nr:pullulanase [Klebsiella pneumoniae subsp. ozaenae]
MTHYARTRAWQRGRVLPNELTTLSDDQARHLADLTRLGMAGNLADFVLIDKDGAWKRGSEIDYNGAPGGYAADPTEVVKLCVKTPTTKRCGT